MLHLHALIPADDTTHDFIVAAEHRSSTLVAERMNEVGGALNVGEEDRHDAVRLLLAAPQPAGDRVLDLLLNALLDRPGERIPPSLVLATGGGCHGGDPW